MRVQRVLGIHVAVFALPNQAIAEIRSYVQSVVAVRGGKLKLAPFVQMPDVVQDQGTVGGFFLLARVISIIRNIGVDGNQARLERETVVADTVNRYVMLAEAENPGYVSLVLFAVFQAFEESVPAGKL